MLRLNDNHIHAIHKNTFEHLQHLEELDLSNNNITSLEAGIFSSMTRLKSLWISSNGLYRVHNVTFRNLTTLRDLSLANNNVSWIEQASFSDLSELKRLWLNNNKITELSNGTFLGLMTLRQLFLCSNRIKAIQSNTFVHLRDLELLSLRNNPISLLDYNGLVGLVSLKSLNLGNTSLTTMTPTDLEGLQRPLELSLDSVDMPCDTRTCWLQKEIWAGTITWYKGGVGPWEPKCSPYWRFHCSGDTLISNRIKPVTTGQGVCRVYVYSGSICFQESF